ncbi:helix-turn-helix domain-containing protein [Actinoplanes sp. M2I2]|uniref:helix-turn-helix domain-containing protein n=1 Tax=Actinoplanes sp. M2I2 TaxID=1734444 RepID=UPI0035AE6CB8
MLEAARELFSERGLGVPMREIARRAEVGPATLYRRFPPHAPGRPGPAGRAA